MNISIRNISKKYRLSRGRSLSVLADISFEVEEGEFISVVGASGSGKSTFLNLVAGLDSPSSGEIWLEGPNRPTQRISGPHPSRIMLFQQPSLLPWLTVWDNIAFGCKLRQEMDDLDYQVDQFIEMMGLFGHEHLYPAELSVGQAQRVCLARALIGHPDILLLDEPFAALDTLTRTRLQEELINIWQSEGFTGILVTHDIEEALLLGNKVVLLGGYPATVKETFAIDLPYPRKLTDREFFMTKKRIIERFREAVIKPQHPDLLEEHRLQMKKEPHVDSDQTQLL